MVKVLSIYWQQRQVLLNLVRKNQPVSRASLRALSGIRLGTVGIIVDNLKTEGLLKECFKKTSPRGRYTGWLEINPSGRLVIGVELSQEKVSGVLTNLLGQDLAEEEILLPVSADQEEIWKAIQETITRLMGISPEVPRAGLGFVDPGLVDFEKGISLYSSILPVWKNVPVRKTLEETFHLPVILSNSEQAKAMAEYWFGQAKGVDNFVFIEYGRGIACGIFSHGQIVRGSQAIAGELGHTRIIGEKKICRCGRPGCLEVLCCWPEIKNLIDKGKDKKIKKRLTYLAVSIATLVNILNPALVILDENFDWLGSERVQELMDRVKEEVFPEAKSRLKVTVSRLGSKIGARGAAAWVLENLFSTGFHLPAHSQRDKKARR
ncbi:MAG: ROK family protein [Candidatus Omnitrophica bacterium]|nr:ROK family protein [Candidatus Omnitrophota bacterium]